MSIVPNRRRKLNPFALQGALEERTRECWKRMHSFRRIRDRSTKPSIRLLFHRMARQELWILRTLLSIRRSAITVGVTPHTSIGITIDDPEAFLAEKENTGE